MITTIIKFLSSRPAIVGVIAIAVLIVVTSFRSCGDPPEAVKVERQVVVERTVDTIVRVIERPPVIVERAVPKIVYRDREIVAQIDTTNGVADTVLRAEPFRAQVDTTVKNLRLRETISFPPLMVSDIEVTLPPDTSLTTRETTQLSERIREEFREGTPWYEKAGYIAGGAAIGAGIAWLLLGSAK